MSNIDIANIIYIILGSFFIIGLLGWIKSWFEPDEKELLKDIRDELQKKNKKDEPLEGKIIE